MSVLCLAGCVDCLDLVLLLAWMLDFIDLFVDFVLIGR